MKNQPKGSGLRQDCDKTVRDLVHFRLGNVPGAVRDNRFIRREQSVGADSTALIQPTRCEISLLERDGVGIVLRLARDLTKDYIITLRSREHQRWPALRLAEVGKREVEDDDIAPHKLAQAASSSGVSQSLARADSAANVGNMASVCASLRDRKNERSLSRSCSGRRSNSRAMSSRLLIRLLPHGKAFEAH